MRSGFEHHYAERLEARSHYNGAGVAKGLARKVQGI